MSIDALIEAAQFLEENGRECVCMSFCFPVQLLRSANVQ